MGLEHVSSLPQLKMIKLKGTSIGSAGMLTLSKVPNLEFVDLTQHKIDPDTLEAMKELRNVREIRFIDCEVTDEQLAALRQSLPDCDVLVENL